MFAAARTARLTTFVALTLSVALPAAGQIRLEELPFRPSGGPEEFELRVSGDGRSVIGQADFGPTIGRTAALWREGEGLSSLGAFPPSSPSQQPMSVGYALSSDGTVASGQSFDGMRQSTGVLFRPGEDPIDETDGLGASFSSWAFDLSGDGSVVVGTAGFPSEGFIYDATRGTRRLSELASGFGASNAAAVSDDGTTVTGWVAADTLSPTEAFLYHEVDGFRRLDQLPNGVRSRGDAISADGSTVVGYATDDVGGFAMKWTDAEGMVSLGSLRPGFPNQRVSQAYGVNADGTVVVGQSNGEAFIHADRYGGMIAVRDLLIQLGAVGVGGFDLEIAIGISDDGRTITGWGSVPSEGRFGVAWRAVIPEPSTALLVGLGLLGMGTARRQADEVRAASRPSIRAA